MKKKIVRKKSKTTKKTMRKKPGPKPGNTRKRKARKKVAKRGPGRPPKKRGPGRPAKKKTVRRVAAKPSQVTLPITAQTDVDFWSNMVGFLNKNKGKDYVVVLDGKSFSLGTK